MSVPRILTAGETDSAPGIGTSHADREWDRFLCVCVPMADGGWRDPGEPMLAPSVTAAEWNALLATGARLRQGRARLARPTARRKAIER